MSELGGMDEFCELRPSFFSSSAIVRAIASILFSSADIFSSSSLFFSSSSLFFSRNSLLAALLSQLAALLSQLCDLTCDVRFALRPVASHAHQLSTLARKSRAFHEGKRAGQRLVWKESDERYPSVSHQRR